MSVAKRLLEKVQAGEISFNDAQVILGAQNPDVEYNAEQVEVLDAMTEEAEKEYGDNFEQIISDEEAEHYNDLAEQEEAIRFHEASHGGF